MWKKLCYFLLKSVLQFIWTCKLTMKTESKQPLKCMLEITHSVLPLSVTESERGYPHHFIWANQWTSDIKTFSWTQCEISKHRRDWCILADNNERIITLSIITLSIASLKLRIEISQLLRIFEKTFGTAASVPLNVQFDNISSGLFDADLCCCCWGGRCFWFWLIVKKPGTWFCV